jgi:hypothetical protein
MKAIKVGKSCDTYGREDKHIKKFGGETEGERLL